MNKKSETKHQIWTSWLAVAVAALSLIVAAGSLYLSLKVDRARSEGMSISVEPIWNGYSAVLSDRSVPGWYSMATQWRVVAVNTSDRPLSIISYQISGNEIGYPISEKGLYDKEGKMVILPLDIRPGESITFSLHVKLWIDQRVFEFAESELKKSEPLPIEELRERLLQAYGIDFFGNDITQRVIHLSRGRGIPYPDKGFEDRKIKIRFVTARQNTFLGTGGWYAYEAIDKQDIGEDFLDVEGELWNIREKLSNKKTQPTPRYGGSD